MTSAPARILDREHALTTVGLVGLICLSAFEALAVTTVMPTVSRDLHGAGLFALAFAAPLASGVVGMVAAGAWSDRHGPAAVLVVAGVLFALGLLGCAFAPTMAVLVGGRLVQGLGAGALIVGIYVVVGRLYEATLQPSIFAAFAAAWVLPSIVGPAIAATIAGSVGWRWVFGGVVVLVAIALAVVWPSLARMDDPRDSTHDVSGRRPPLLLASAVAAAVLAVELLGRGTGALLWLTPVAVVLALVGVRGLLPAGSLRLVRGLPAVISLRGLLSGAYFSAEAYLPLVLQDQWHLTPTAAGFALTGAALGWSVASQWQARWGKPLSDEAVLLLGSGVVAAGAALMVAAVLLTLPLGAVIGGYVLGAAGMGMAYPRTSVAALGHSGERDRGQNMSALSIADSMSGALALSLTGVAVEAGRRATLAQPVTLAYALALAVGALAVVAAYRTPSARTAAGTTRAQTTPSRTTPLPAPGSPRDVRRAARRTRGE